ncbi:Hypothetical predicted protein [Olea europaea subsp. europaea]|uniref:F-box associated beta-propeller type 3 domain-containing protein n=1 Tax=Olea europaea subsp. europaea TaxID=158383 RepID=A0A8S0V476_OLEEU|nr:Hypothetical predicted protein [Olea europaea subsp. europaea]
METATERIQGNYYLPVTYSEGYYMVSCHNLVCFVGRKISIHNLSTQETIIPPDSGSFFYAGLGYSSLANEYKLVKWFGQKNNGIITMECKIFDLSNRLRFKSDSWRFTETRPFEDLDLHPVSGNGVIYWLTRNHRDFYQTDSILALDLDKEESKITSCPKRSPSTKAYLLELKECLYFAHCWREKAIVKMWRLEDPNNCVWISEYYINFPSICNSIVPVTSVLAAHVEMLVFLSLEGQDLLYYNVDSGTMRTIDKLWH